MANTLNDLYLKYVNKVGAVLEKDRYFQYLFAMTQAGHTTLSQSNKLLHKVVDEEWLSTIEDSLDAINTIIANPRRFVATSEEVVPVELAKKITAESVRHLSQNTQFIAPSEDGEIHPTRILNVTTEDSYDLYENRFVYHLIQRLVTFIDKRTDLIFWSTGDETMNTLAMESKVDDAYETIEYRLEMKIKNTQSFAENDGANMEVFMRIDRVRRLVMALRVSPFCSLMAGCAKVRSPIQRTNLMMKDPHYRKCYQLWQFLENYDSQGYTIEEIDRPLAFDEEYLLQMQTGLVTNYTVFKSILESDGRNVDETPPKRRRVIKPRFVKRIQEQIVDNFDIEDVEIRRVFVEEVTQAQLDAEEKAAQETKRAEEARQSCEEAERRASEAYSRMQNAIDQLAAAERQTADAVRAKDEAESTLVRTVREAEENIRQAQRARLDAEKRAEECLDAKGTAEVQLRLALEARKQAEARATQMAEERDAAEKQMLSDRVVREKAQKEQLRERQARKRAEARIQKAEEKAQGAKQVLDEAKQTRAEAEKLRNKAENAAAAAEMLRLRAEERRAAAEQGARESRNAMQEAEKAREKAERQAQRAAEDAQRAREERKTALAESRRVLAKHRSMEQAIEDAGKRLKAAQEALAAERAALEAERAAREAVEQTARETAEKLAAESAARAAAERRASANTLAGRLRSAFGGGRREER